MKNDDVDDDWVSDPRVQPDAFEAGLERALAPARFDAGRRPLVLPAEDTPRSNWKRIAAAALVVAAAGVVAWFALRDRRVESSAFEVVGSSGDVEWDPARSLECGAGGTARLRIASIGTLELAEHSKLALQRGDAEGYRVFLERGTLTASIFAAPRLFAVGTPSGLAVDLGCVYRTHVEDDGSARIEVVSGRVSFEADGVHALVPAGAECRARPGQGPGLPRWSDASGALVAALTRFETSQSDGERTAAIVGLLTASEKHDVITLFHLLERARDGERERILRRLEQWVEIPPGIDRAQLVAGDRDAFAEWREVLRWSW